MLVATRVLRPESEGAVDDCREGCEVGENDSSSVGVGEVGVVVGSSSDTRSGGNTSSGIVTGDLGSTGVLCGETGSSTKLLVGDVGGVPGEWLD
jgi:hypothetical protein